MFKTILSPFIEFDAKPKAEVQPVPAQQGAAPTVIAAPLAVPDQKSAEMRALLMQTVNGRQTPYTALLGSAEKLKAVIADPSTRLKAAFVSGGANVEALTNAILIHIQDLTGSKRQFQAAADQQTAELEIQKRQCAELQELAKRNRETAQQLMDEATATEQKVTALTADISQKQASIASNLQLFDSTLAQVKSELEAERASLTSLLS